MALKRCELLNEVEARGVRLTAQRRALIEKRLDDMDPHVLHTRMEVYEQDTRKLLHHYPEKLICRFDADQRPLEVLRDVLIGLSPLLSRK